jgi:ubiquinone/menaquinone biosynthesis C-methylase UbiE
MRRRRPIGETALSLYGRRVLPGLIDYAMRQKRLTPLREALVGEAAGSVLEVGVGSGLNLPLYPRTVDVVYGVDPSRELLERAKKHTAWVHFPVHLTEGTAEDLPLHDHSVDCAVTTWTLCSVADPARGLAEIRRVLRPGGALLFVEHGQAPEARIRRWQDRLTPLWRRCAGGCHLNRPIATLIEAAGFDVTELETGHLIQGPRIATFHYRGRAVA